MQISIAKHSIQLQNLNQSADLESVLSPTPPGQRRTFLAKKRIFGKKSCFLPKITNFWNFQKVNLRLQRYTSSIMSTFLQCDAPVRGDK